MGMRHLFTTCVVLFKKVKITALASMPLVG